MGSRHFFTIVFYKFDGHDFCKIQALLIYDSLILLQDICTEKFGCVNTRSVGVFLSFFLSILSRSNFDHHLRCGGWLNFEFS